MIVSFFVFFNYLLGILKARYNAKNKPESGEPNSSSISAISQLTFEGGAVYEGNGVQFFPPVYCQRYSAVVDVLQSHRLRGSIKKIIDLGCSELSLFGFIKRVEGVEEYIGVDIDEETLKRNFTKAIPLTADYLARRSAPLKVTVLRGSATQPDLRLKGTNVVVAIELIEHMYPNELNELPYNVFGIICPEIAIFTTPNSDFNVLFTTLELFRHPDHKFEWSRTEFEDWANNLTVQYPDYEVTFHGIGKGPDGTQHLGCCSQMAVFLRKAERFINSDKEYSVLHECIYEVQYPFQTPEEKLEELLDYEVYHILNKFSENEEFLVEDRMEIPLDAVIKNISIECPADKVLDFLKRGQKDIQYINNQATLILPYYGLEDNFSLSYDDNYDCNYASNDEANDEPVHEYWDLSFNDVNDFIMKSSEPEDEIGPENIFPVPDSYNVQNGNLSKETMRELSPVRSLNEDTIVVSNNEVASSSSRDEKVNKSAVNLEQFDFPKSRKEAALKQVNEMLSAETFPYQCTDPTPSLDPSSLSNAVCESACGLPCSTENLTQISSLFSEKLKPFTSHSNLQRSCDFPSEKLGADNAGSYKTPGGLFQRHDDPSMLVITSNSKRPDKSVDGKLNSCKQASLVNCSSKCLPLISSSINHREHGIPKVEEKNMSSSIKVMSIEQPSSSVQRCHSLENVNVNNSKNQKFRYSLNIDNDHIDCDRSVVDKDHAAYGRIDCDTRIVDMDLEMFGKGSSIPSLTDTFGSHSKAPDSGYPNSTHDMDMDLTPEQVDEIITETESSLEDEESSVDERVEELQDLNPPVVFLDNVENGDVANNNRDGEGNNMEGGEVIEEIVGFEGMGAEGGDVEAGPHESDDEGLYHSALDVSNDTLVPEESSSHDADAFNSAFDLPSSSSFLRPFELQCNVQPEPVEQAEFPSWLLDILVNDLNPAGGDAAEHRSHNGSTSSSESIIVESTSTLVEVIVPGDVMGGGEPPLPN